MEIPLNAQVECTDGICGHSVYVLINPVNDQVTHLVVKEDTSPNTEYVVPACFASETVGGTIQLCFSKAELEKMDPFIKKTFFETKIPVTYVASGSGYGNGMGTNFYWPYVSYKGAVQVPVEERQIPIGELAVKRGTRVEATDGFVGYADEFVINPENNHITHLVMREGHLWGQKDVIIPLSAMGETLGDTVYLNLDKHHIESLPTFPLQRRWA